MLKQISLNLFSLLLFPLAAGNNSGPTWFTWLLIIIVVILLIWFLWRWFTRPKSTQNQPVKPATPVVKASPPPVSPMVPAAPAAPVSAAPQKPDDLTVIEGISPKISSLLQAAGINTFLQLSGADSSRLSQITNASGLQFVDTATWPEQAKLAADGKWDELKVLQDNLKGGRRV